jgi:deoxyribonuclease-4
MRFGVHVSIGNGFTKAVAEAEKLGCDTFQIFAGNPRGWARKPLPDRETAGFRKALAASGLGPAVVHLSYLPNPASPNDEIYEKSIVALREDFDRANRLGAGFFVMHPGSCPRERREEGLRRVVAGLNTVLAEVEGPTVLLLENQGGLKSDMAADLNEMAELLAALDRNRCGICLDTCHAFVAGYDLRTKDGWDAMLALVSGKIGLDRLGAIHANDAKAGLGSGLDRHEHIGEGQLGEGAFTALGQLPELANRPVILETPRNGPADDRRNLARIRSLAGQGS